MPRETRSTVRKGLPINDPIIEMGLEEESACAVMAPAKQPRSAAGSKRKAAAADVVDLTDVEPKAKSTATAKARKSTEGKAKADEPAPERRLKMFRKHAPKTYLEKLQRARTQRMYVFGHGVKWIEGFPEMEFDMAGTTGNVYKVIIGKVPFCSCPDSLKGNQCKHICYVLVNALKAPAHLQYQLAFLSTELTEIYQGSPLSREQQPTAEEQNIAGTRKPIEGDCPICFMEFESDTEEIVWCKAACGNNIHKGCFDKWAATLRAQGVTCVYCRTPWKYDNESVNIDQIKKTGRVNEEGYVNVADQLGLSGERDCSTYYQPWGSRESYYYGSRSRRWY